MFAPLLSEFDQQQCPDDGVARRVIGRDLLHEPDPLQKLFLVDDVSVKPFGESCGARIVVRALM
jgi:hypothetical protein